MLRFWSFIKTKEGLLSIIILTFVGVPLVLSIFNGIKSTFMDTFGIKTDSEIKAEQKVVIDKITEENRNLKKINEIKAKIVKINEKKVIDEIKEEKKIDEFKINLIKEVDKEPDVKVKEQVKVITKNKSPQTVIIDKKKYEEEGLKNINLIYQAYELVKDVK